jgi:hypothetical protein
MTRKKISFREIRTSGHLCEMTPVGLDHDDQAPIDHRDVFECRRCSRTEYGDWFPCDCVQHEPEEYTDKLNDRLEQGR